MKATRPFIDGEFVDNALGEYSAPYLRDPSYSYFGIFVHRGKV